ncbi:MAG: polysaccharide deacetylase family protein [Candidatus Sungbacteria bacterium]|uniref:Polysaccharide deacetylase family protein n=1 Tax=Candidatus Sungiibacteriota bacterium TaxID=2750080 RepID=A0A9D6LPC4_9BACT|nr:polysaccharide deacetylase family protein [Candidatus Sungbacteria bacterium]
MGKGIFANRLKQAIRLFTLGFLSLCCRLVSPWLSRPEVLVLVYHSVRDDDWFYSVSPADFQRQIKYIKEQYHPVSLADVCQYAKGIKLLAHRSIAVTFDDGYEDFKTNALPILEMYQIPVTLFVSAGVVDAKDLGTNLPTLQGVALKEISAHPLVKIGSHAMTHRKLTRLSAENQKEEVIKSKRLLEAMLEIPVHFFAYPKGNFSTGTRNIIKDAGYRGAVTVIQTTIKPGNDPYLLPRIQIDRSIGFSEFVLRLTRVADWYYALWCLIIHG